VDALARTNQTLFQWMFGLANDPGFVEDAQTKQVRIVSPPHAWWNRYDATARLNLRMFFFENILLLLLLAFEVG
jgi:hypothetical protein